MPLSTLPLTNAACKLPNARAMRSLKRIGIVQSIQAFQTYREHALTHRGHPECVQSARMFARMAREEWAVVSKWLFA